MMNWKVGKNVLNFIFSFNICWKKENDGEQDAHTKPHVVFKVKQEIAEA